MEILVFCSGILFFYTHSILILIGIPIILFLKAPWQIILWFLAAMCWAWLHQWLIADLGMPQSLVIPKTHLVGEISSIPTFTDSKSQFQFLIHQLNNNPVNASVLLNCYNHCPQFKTGEFWEFDAKLKQPINLANPGNFDYAGKLRANHVSWTGYIKDGSSKRIPNKEHGFWLKKLREQLAEKIAEGMAGREGLGIVQAISLGVTNHISQAQWDLFRRTGTTHLMVISGAHIGLVAGLSFLLIEWLWRCSGRLCLYCPSQQVASIIALIGAFVYAILAGFAIPAERSLIACALVLGKNFLNRRFTGWQAWRYGLFIVLIGEPHAVLLPGFYLSFIAVAILISCSQRLVVRGFKKNLYLQLACLFGLMPMTLYWFSYSATNGFLANIVAIPLVGYVIVPLSLITVLFNQITSMSFLFIGLHYLTKGLLFYLNWVDASALINLEFSINEPFAMLALMLAFALAIFLPIKAVWPAIVIIVISVFVPYHARPLLGEAMVNVLDVGQGLSVFIQTAHHRMLYDTGVKFYNGSDMGKLAILPYFRYHGITSLDKVVISHPDLDHRGGLVSIEQKIAIDELIVNDVDFYHRGENCHQYPDWEWDGVKFHFLAIKAGFDKTNNTCCVLQVKTAGGAVLLPGDIEKQAEVYLLQHYPEQLKSDVVVVPHHGSKTSSSLGFIQQIAPKYAIISAGFDNRYHFPHQDTLRNLAREHVSVLNTTDCGMVSFTLSKQSGLVEPKCYKSG